MLDEATQYRLLGLLADNPEVSQRALARDIGFSLGKTNYCLRALMDKGWVKVRAFRNSSNRSAYVYQLTPAGVREKVRATRRFLARRLEEHDAIVAEIESLREEVRRNEQAAADDGD